MRGNFLNRAVIVLFICSILVVGSVAAYSAFTLPLTGKYLREDIEDRMLVVSQSAAALVSAHELDRFTTPESVHLPQYLELKEVLSEFAQSYRVEFVYYYRLTPAGMVQPVIDNDHTEKAYSLETTPLEMEEGVRLAFEGNVVTPGLESYSAGYEGLLTAYAPLFDDTGRVAYVAGVDVVDEKVLGQDKLLDTFAVLLVISVLLVAITGVLALVLQLRRERFLHDRLGQQEVMLHISRSFIRSQEVNALINDAMATTAHSLKVFGVILFVIDKEDADLYPTFTYPPLLEPYPPELKQQLDEEWQHTFKPYLTQESDTTALAFDDVRNWDKPLFAQLHRLYNTSSIVVSPIYVENALWGALVAVERGRFRNWSLHDRNMLDSVSLSIAGAVAREKIERERKLAMEEAVRASAAKGSFLSNMSHEMRTPMNAIIGMSYIGIDASSLERKDYCLHRISEASQHLLGIINDVLDLSKIEANKLEVSFASFNFEHMIKRVVDVMQFKTSEKHQNLTVELDPRLPECILNDDQRLAQVITNLLSNANKFTPAEGSITLVCKLVSCSEDSYTICVSVIDTGIGLSAEQQGRLFHSYEQATSTTSHEFGGTGLGLSISKQIVELLGGRIWVESTEGAGATFAFEFETQAGECTASEQEDISLDEVSFKGLNLLVAEDIEVNREIIIALLEDTGINIHAVENGREAVEAFVEKPDFYDVIFMDIQMPEMDGLEATRAIRALDVQRAHTIPIVAMTANVFHEDVARCMDAGMNAHLGKPIDLHEVLNRLAHLLTHE